MQSKARRRAVEGEMSTSLGVGANKGSCGTHQKTQRSGRASQGIAVHCVSCFYEGDSKLTLT